MLETWGIILDKLDEESLENVTKKETDPDCIDGKSVKGVITNDIGLDKNNKPKDSFEPGMEFHAKIVLLAKGCHGSLSKMAIERFNSREGKDPQTYGLGIKEVWRVKEDLDVSLEDNLVSLGLVVGLDYPNPYLSPYQEFQRLKHHPPFSKSIPKLTFPGGALIGCSAGFLNVPKIKGTHTAMKSGMIAAEVVFQALVSNTSSANKAKSIELVDYQEKLDQSWVMKELKESLLKGKSSLDFHHKKEDFAHTKSIKEYKPIEYPAPDHKLSFDILTSVSRTGTNYAENQPNHLVIKPENLDHHLEINVNDSLDQSAGLLNKACPAGV
ncbi:hypothetical protein KEM48_009395 [Puccinia striiformis f. sp. tritici PST-130]|nr:hypothetical protein KEM48_009395 [Puccinia striiformis f. sp. tritici PST-130]